MRKLKYYTKFAFIHGFLLLPLWVCAIVCWPIATRGDRKEFWAQVKTLNKSILGSVE